MDMETANTDNSPNFIGQQKLINELISDNKQYREKIEYLNERIDQLLAQFYGKKSERRSILEIPDQLSYLEELPEEPAADLPVEPIIVPTHNRKKPGRKPLPEELPRVDVIHDIPENQKQCSCGSLLSWIGEEILEQLNYIPARLEVIRNIRPKYACKNCEGVETDGSTVKIDPPLKQILPKTIASSGLLAQIITAKFVDSLPFYRQEKQFLRLGYQVSRTNMANWTIQLSGILEKLLGLLKQEILSGPLINMDETTLQVLKEKGRSPTSKSYMWIMRGGTPENPGIYFEYNPSRSSDVAKRLLENFQGIVQTDGYVGYDFIKDVSVIEHAGCWAHSRRKFFEILKAKGKYQKKKAKSGHADRALIFISQLYTIERQADADKLSDSQRVTLRQEKSKPILDEFHRWLKSIKDQIPPKSLLGKATFYTLKRWEQLTLYLHYGFVPMDNNPAENAIRPFVVGRKNWLFCDTVPGAMASAKLYSLIETAKANKLNPYEYLKSLFNRLPYVENEPQLKNLLPQYFKTTTSESD